MKIELRYSVWDYAGDDRYKSPTTHDEEFEFPDDISSEELFERIWNIVRPTYIDQYTAADYRVDRVLNLDKMEFIKIPDGFNDLIECYIKGAKETLKKKEELRQAQNTLANIEKQIRENSLETQREKAKKEVKEAEEALEKIQSKKYGE